MKIKFSEWLKIFSGENNEVDSLTDALEKKVS